MKLGTLTTYSDKLLKGNYLKSVLFCMSICGASLIFMLAEASLYSIQLYFGNIKPVMLFTGESSIQLLILLICTALRYIVTAPLQYATAYWFMSLCHEQKKHRRASIGRMIPDFKTYCKSLAVLLGSKLVGTAFLLPTAFFGIITVSVLSDGIEKSGSFNLLMLVHAAVMTVLSIGLWLRAKLTLLSVPFLMSVYRNESSIGLIKHSFKFMKRRRLIFLKLVAKYGLLMLPIVTIPIFLPKLYTASALGIDIFVKEDEYLERNKICCGYRETRHASKLFAWTKRRFTQTVDKA